MRTAYDPTTLHSHHLKYIWYDILTGYFYQSLMKSLSQHIRERLCRRLNALGTQEVSFTRPTSTAQYLLPPVGQGTPRAAHGGVRKYCPVRRPQVGGHAQRTLKPALPRPGARSAKRLTCTYTYDDGPLRGTRSRVGLLLVTLLHSILVCSTVQYYCSTQ